MPVKGGITPDQRVKLDRLSRSNYLSEKGKQRVVKVMNDPKTDEIAADLIIEEVNNVIKQRKSDIK